MSTPEDELEFINVVEHGAGSQSASLGGVGTSRVSGLENRGDGSGFAGGYLGFICQSRHKMAALFHYMFKFLALLFYIMGGFKFVSSRAILTYIICILMLAFDFWTVKNISGRLMVRDPFFCMCVLTCLRFLSSLLASVVLGLIRMVDIFDESSPEKFASTIIFEKIKLQYRN